MRSVSRAPRIKICGITTPEAGAHAVEAGAWAIGLMFWPDSPRALSLISRHLSSPGMAVGWT